MTNKSVLRVLRGEVLDVPPVWLMRQAGRYLPEYKATRAQAGSFLKVEVGGGVAHFLFQMFQVGPQIIADERSFI